MTPYTQNYAKLEVPVKAAASRLIDTDDATEALHSAKRQRTDTGSTALDSEILLAAQNASKLFDHPMDSDKDRSPTTSQYRVRQMTSQTVPNDKPLKGRKRFKADLADLEDESKRGAVYAGMRLSQCRPGEDEGSIELVVEDSSSAGKVFHISIYISDTSDYPLSHTFFAASSSLDLPTSVQDVIESVSEGSSQPIQDTVSKLVSSISLSLRGSKDETQNTDESEEDDDGSELYDGYDDFDYDSAPKSKSRDQLSGFLPRIHTEFLEIVAAGYRPGLIHLAAGDYCLSVSLPIVTLATIIPPRALMAWDRRLLSRTQHLTLLISGFRSVYPPLTVDGLYTQESSKTGTSVTFKVGLSQRYKAGAEHAQQAFRTYGLIARDEPAPTGSESVYEETEIADDGRFDSFSLSSSLESLLNNNLLKVIQYRRKFGLGWAAAELLYSLVEQKQAPAEDVLTSNLDALRTEDQEEYELTQTYDLPEDVLKGLSPTADLNLPLIAFSYLIRRLLFVSRYCVVCHNKTAAQFEALKPYVCESKLCSYRYYAFNQGPSLEYEIIHNTEVVDLLVSLAYCSASEGVMDDPMPVGMGLLVKLPHHYTYGEVKPTASSDSQAANDQLYNFDKLDKVQMRRAIVCLIDDLPSIVDMKKYLLQPVKPGQSKPKLRDIDPSIIPAAWSVLRWCIASCTAHLEELQGENLVGNVDSSWRQFRFSVGAPDAEAKFKAAIEGARQRNSNTNIYPTLYAFHGSPLKNWHSIIRHGLWYKEVAHGRAYGDGVYLAKDGSVSMTGYAHPSKASWMNSSIFPTRCVALAEVVNIRPEFVSSDPYYVVAQTSWIMCRYLLVKGTDVRDLPGMDEINTSGTPVPSVRLDPTTPVTLNTTQLDIPEPTFQIDRLLDARRRESVEEANDDEDESILHLGAETQQHSSQLVGDWLPDSAYVRQAISNLMPPPFDSTSTASSAVQRELREMLRDQNVAKKIPGGLKALGWYLPDLSDDGDDTEGGGIMDNLFQWIVELHSFDEKLPLSEDMKRRGINSLLFEIRFPPNFPHSPPFFRLITPRFLSFSQGGGGHVTFGGSICMDLLTADGWLPSYNIASVLLQIKLALSNLDPYPAKLAENWDRPYGITEALEGYKRAALVHGWRDLKRWFVETRGPEV